MIVVLERFAYLWNCTRGTLSVGNEVLGVWEQDEERDTKEWGRYLVLIHPGNTVKDVVGCIAPGISGTEDSVIDSRKAMLKIHTALDGWEHEIIIRPKGAS